MDLNHLITKSGRLIRDFYNPDRYKAEKNFILTQVSCDNLEEAFWLFNHNFKSPLKCKACDASLNFLSFYRGYYNDCFCPSCSLKQGNKKAQLTVSQMRYNFSNPKLFQNQIEIGGKLKKQVLKSVQVLEHLEKIYPSISPIEAIWLYVNGYSEPKRCKCGNNLVFVSYSRGYYRDVCSTCGMVEMVETQTRKNLAKYGKASVLSVPAIREKINQTNLERYGMVYSGAEPQRIKKARDTVKRNTFKRKLKHWENRVIPNFDETDFIAATFKYHLFDFTCVKCGTSFRDDVANGNFPTCPTCYPSISGKSKFEIAVNAYIASIDNSFEFNTRKVISPKELDAYSETKKLAFECTGVYWHAGKEVGKPELTHFSKLERCEMLGIRLSLIYEDEWIQQKEIVKSRISNMLGVNTRRIYARDCTVEEVEQSDAKLFFQENHLQGSSISSVRFGLFYEGELVACMSFGKPRFNKKVEWELIRFANAKFTTIVGGASRLFSAFVKRVNPISVISYADRRWSSGKLYTILGFELDAKTPPGYSYSRGKKRYNRLQLCKKRMKQDFPEKFDETLNEEQNAFNMGFRRLYDCGQMRFIWRK